VDTIAEITRPTIRDGQKYNKAVALWELTKDKLLKSAKVNFV
jgi:hypothetical protein